MPVATPLFDQLDQAAASGYVGQVDQLGGKSLQTNNLYDAKTRLSELVDRASAGEENVIAKNGRPLAPPGADPGRKAESLATLEVGGHGLDRRRLRRAACRRGPRYFDGDDDRDRRVRLLFDARVFLWWRAARGDARRSDGGDPLGGRRVRERGVRLGGLDQGRDGKDWPDGVVRQWHRAEQLCSAAPSTSVHAAVAGELPPASSRPVRSNTRGAGAIGAPNAGLARPPARTLRRGNRLGVTGCSSYLSFGSANLAICMSIDFDDSIRVRSGSRCHQVAPACPPRGTRALRCDSTQASDPTCSTPRRRAPETDCTFPTGRGCPPTSSDDHWGVMFDVTVMLNAQEIAFGSAGPRLARFTRPQPLSDLVLSPGHPQQVARLKVRARVRISRLAKRNRRGHEGGSLNHRCEA